MTLSIISRRAVLALLLAVPLIAAQRATDPVAQYNVTVSPWVNHRYVAVGVYASQPLVLVSKCMSSFAESMRH